MKYCFSLLISLMYFPGFSQTHSDLYRRVDSLMRYELGFRPGPNATTSPPDTAAKSKPLPGAGGKPVIRMISFSTLPANREPLVMFHGVPLAKHCLDALQLRDTRSIQLVKGPTAVALYGTRASEGVVVMEARKGKAKRKIDRVVSSCK